MARSVAVSLHGGTLVVGLLLALQQQDRLVPAIPASVSALSVPRVDVSSADELEAAKARWNAAAIHDYVITVMRFRGFLHTESHTITVKDGKAVSDRAYCASAAMEAGNCVIAPIPLERFSVAGLLSDAEELAKRGGQAARFRFDPVLGIPLDASDGRSSMIADSGGFWIEKFEQSS
jgi:hypothetical protein